MGWDVAVVNCGWLRDRFGRSSSFGLRGRCGFEHAAAECSRRSGNVSRRQAAACVEQPFEPLPERREGGAVVAHPDPHATAGQARPMAANSRSRSSLTRRAAPLADRHRRRLRARPRGALAPVGPRLAQVVRMAVREVRQMLEARVAEHLVLAPHHRARGRPDSCPRISSTSASSLTSAAVWRRFSDCSAWTTVTKNGA